jgi:ComF family protein
VLRCRECAARRLAFATARAAVGYDHDVRAIVTAWKERGLRRLAVVAAELVAEAVQRPDAAAIVFVPPDRDRALRRGHHPPEQLARELGGRWQLPVEPLLRRTRTIERQRGLDRDARRRNVARAFAAAARLPARVVLVDDVYTSGATAASASSALRAGGAQRVHVVTLARAIRRG